ncbi:MAG: hypothetical protein JJ975_09620 [Bacteroidia bacterium]|nr:hypothetical protein [Bacteroidia bacterium]
MAEDLTYGRKNESTFLSRLDLFIHQEYGSRVKFCQAIGMPTSTLSSYFSKKKAKPTLDFFENLASVHPELDLAWLISGRSASVSSYRPTGMGMVNESNEEYKNLNSILSELTEAIQNSNFNELTEAIRDLSRKSG